MTRTPSEITRTVNGVTERLCLTPGCGWHQQTKAHFRRKVDRQPPRWASRCIKCHVARITTRPPKRDAELGPTPPDLTWARLLP